MPRLAPVVSTLARQTMRLAFDDLERTITPADAQEMRAVSTIEQVRHAALRIESQLAARQSLRNMRRLTPLLSGMEHYSRVVDILCNGTPYLSWIWAPITLILRVASDFVEAFEQIMKGYTKIADALMRFEILSDTFATDIDFQQSLATYYADILQFHKHAYVFVRRSSWKLLFLNSWGRFERQFKNILEDLERHGALIDQGANARGIAEMRQMHEELQAWKEESKKNMEHEDKHQQAKEFEAILTWLKTDESEQLSILESVSAERHMYPGTSTWLLKNDKIKAWLRKAPGKSLLWLYGSPGTGKSVIMAELVNFLHSSNASTIHHFCTYTYASSTRYEGILRSLLLQTLRHDGDLVNHVYQEQVLARKPATVTTLERLLQTVVVARSHEPRQPEYLWFLVDGLNECEVSKQQRLTSLLNQLSSASASQTVVKVLISTRKVPVMSRRLQKTQILSLSDEENTLTASIRIYASCRLRLMESRLRQIELDTDEIEEIECLVAERARGMFLYARLVLDYINSNVFYDIGELKDSIQQLPQTLADFYKKLLMQILKNLDDRSQNRVKTVYSWIAFAKRPLRKLELLSALSFSDGKSDAIKLAPTYILDDTCSPLLLQKHDTTLTFIHVTVKDYLESLASPLRLSEKEAICQHSIATTACLLSSCKFLSVGPDNHSRLLRLVKGLHGLHVYATEYWVEYLLSTVNQDVTTDASSPALELAIHLAHSFEFIVPAPCITEKLDARLEQLEPYALLCRHINWVLQGRSQKRLELEVFKRPESSEADITLDVTSLMLNEYQKAVESILDLDSLPGASAEDLDVFKSQFRASAYTCRLRSCPRATLGFETAQLRYNHELSHTGGVRCPTSGCQFPPFRNAQALRTHTLKYHAENREWRSIRRKKGQEFQSFTPTDRGHGAMASSHQRTKPPVVPPPRLSQPESSVKGPKHGAPFTSHTLPSNIEPQSIGTTTRSMDFPGIDDSDFTNLLGFNDEDLIEFGGEPADSQHRQKPHQFTLPPLPSSLDSAALENLDFDVYPSPGLFPPAYYQHPPKRIENLPSIGEALRSESENLPVSNETVSSAGRSSVKLQDSMTKHSYVDLTLLKGRQSPYIERRSNFRTTLGPTQNGAVMVDSQHENLSQYLATFPSFPSEFLRSIDEDPIAPWEPLMKAQTGPMLPPSREPRQQISQTSNNVHQQQSLNKVSASDIIAPETVSSESRLPSTVEIYEALGYDGMEMTDLIHRFKDRINDGEMSRFVERANAIADSSRGGLVKRINYADAVHLM